MGNQLLKGYNISGQPIPGVGTYKIWKLYHGTRQSTNSPVTIFAVEKRNLKASEREQILRVAKKQSVSLARIRHPGVLALSETLIEDQQILAFSTQRIIGNLTTLHRQKRLKQIVSNQLQLRLNLLSILDTIKFLHQNVKTIHLSINFDNIYITKEGKWKIAGLGQSQIYNGQGLQTISDYKYDDLSFCSPQVALNKQFQRTSDVYSIGILILNLLLVINNDYQLQNFKSKEQYQQNFEKTIIKKVNNSSLQKLQNYKDMKLLLKSIFNRDYQKRCTLSDLSTSKWLNDRLVLTVKYLQNITAYDNKQQVQFLKGLMGVLHDFNRKILIKRIFPALIDYLKFKHLVPSIIYICVQVAKDGKIINVSQFNDHIWPHLKKVTLGKQMTAHSIFMLVQNMSLFQKIVSINDVKQTLIPLYIKCFDCPPKLKELALKKTQYIMSKMDYIFIKTKMVPKIMSCMRDANPQIRKKSLIALKKCIKTLDSQAIISYVLPGLQSSRKAGTDPFINSITVHIYAQLGKSLSTQIISSKLIPTILPYLTDPSVSKDDFFNYKKTLIDMLQKIQFQRQKLWQNQDPNAKIYTQKDFQFTQQLQQSKSQKTQIGGGNFNFLNNYQRSQPTTTQQQTNFNYPNQQQQTNLNYTNQQQNNQYVNTNQQQNKHPSSQQPSKNTIDFTSLNFKQQDNFTQISKQQKHHDSYNFANLSSPQTFQQNTSQTKNFKGPQSKPIKPIRKQPSKQQSFNDPFSFNLQQTNSISSNQNYNQSYNYNNPSNQINTFNTKNTNYGGFPVQDDPFSQIKKPSLNKQIPSMGYQNYNKQQSLGNKDIFGEGNNDPFIGLSQNNNNSLDMNFSNTNYQNTSYQNTNTQNQMNTNTSMNQNNMNFNMNQIGNNNNNQMSFDFNQPPPKKKDDFDLLL